MSDADSGNFPPGMRERLISGIAHDVCNLVGSLQVQGDLMRRQCQQIEARLDAEPDLRRIVERLHVDMDRTMGASLMLSDLVRGLIELTRPGPSNWTDLDPVPFDLGDLFLPLSPLFDSRASSKRLLLQFDSPERGTWVETDLIKVRRLLINLIDNAIKFTPRGRVTVSARAVSPAQLRLDVKDSGPGMSAELLRELGSPATAARLNPDPGFGLGYSIVKRLVAALEGRLEIDSLPGQGTWVRVELPVRILRGRGASGLGSPGALNLDGMLTTLVVRDPMFASALESALRQQGAKVLTVREAAELAICLRAGIRPDAIVVDGEEVTSGWAQLSLTAAEALKLKPMKLVLLTPERLAEAARQDFLEMGVPWKVLRKPVGVAELIDAVAEDRRRKVEASAGVGRPGRSG